MATKKKKDTVPMPGTIGAAKLVFPQVVKGSHLTVTTYEDGRTELEWDHDQLLKDVQDAIASVQEPAAAAKIAKKSKVTHRVKSFE